MRTNKIVGSYIATGLCAVIIATLMFFAVLPYGALLVGSLMPEGASTAKGLSFESFTQNRLSLTNYKAIFGEASEEYLPYVVNTFVVSTVSSLTAVGLSTLAGYGLTRFYTVQTVNRVRRYVLLGYVFPPIVLVIPYVSLLHAAHLSNTRFGLILAHIAFCPPFSLWLCLRYLDAVPRQYDVTAALDGAYWWSSFYRVVARQALPGLLSVWLLVFIVSWNDVALAQHLIKTNSLHTVSVAFQENLWSSGAGPQWERLCAAGVLLVLPIGVALLWMSIANYLQHRRTSENV